ncbi:MAG: tRNA uridine-5-carboxymethylaminomethyl(34) synthesis GTPase MnmE [Flavobacteriales bacterium]|nr:tRNA uridine-5-carboxymethylaminomethyl(34) synthesis GTPase MnmE [Flavobacteriales bacterium]
MTALPSDTIAAPATPAGVGAIAVLRLSGSRALEIAAGIFAGKNLSNQPSHTLHFGKIYDGDQLIDEVVASIYRGPNSYTGEDVVEISTHGSPFIVQRMIALLCARGARPANPGEFTLRAFLNGKLDLAQAEAVADLIASDSAASHRLAITQMRGGFSTQLQQMRQELIHFASLVELELDFAEEDVDFADRTELQTLIEKILTGIKNLSDSFAGGNVLKEGVSVALVGKPNAGKSTLLNTLLNEDRAIVTEIAGTTRDTLEDRAVIEGIMFRFIDTAGMRDTQDRIEALGVARSKAAMRDAVVVLYLFDASENTPEEMRSERDEAARICAEHGNVLLPVANKIDKIERAVQEAIINATGAIPISAKNGVGIDTLKTGLMQCIPDSTVAGAGETVVSNARHFHALNEAGAALQRARDGLMNGITGDLLAADIRHALYFLGLITGEIHTEDLLDNIFSKFCIGK